MVGPEVKGAVKIAGWTCLAIFGLGPLHAQDAVNTHLTAAGKARDQKKYADAEREGMAAVLEAEKLDPKGERLSGALADLGWTFYVERKLAEAELKYRRAIEVGEVAGINPGALSNHWQHLGWVQISADRPEDAIASYERALPIREKIFGPDHVNVSYILSNLAYAKFQMQKFAEADALLRRALKIQGGLTGRDRLTTASTMLQMRRVLDAEAKYDEEEAILRQALRLREAVSGPEDWTVAEVLDWLGDFLRMRQRQDREAETVLRRALAITQKKLPPDHRLVGDICNDLALVVRNFNHFDEAEDLFLRALDITDKNRDESFRGRVAGNLARLYLIEGKLQEAEKMAVQSVAIREKFEGERERLVFELENLADVYSAQKRFDLATPMYKRCVAIREKTYGPDHPDLADSLRRLAYCLDQQKRSAESEPLYRRSLEIIEKRYGAKDVKTAAALEGLANSYRGQARLLDDEPLRRRALAIREQLPDATPAKLATPRNNFAVLLREMGRYREAAELLEKSIADSDEKEAAHGRQMAIRLANLGDVYRSQGWYARGEPLILKSIDVDDTSSTAGTLFTPPGAFAVDKLIRLARIDFDRQKYGEALPLLEQALALAGKNQDTERRAVVLAELGMVRCEMRQFNDAAKLYDEAQALREREPVETPRLARLLDDKGLLSIRQGKLLEAEASLLRSRRIYERTVGTESALTALCLAHLATVYRGEKRPSEAETLLKQAIPLLERAAGADAPVLAPVLREYSQLLRSLHRETEAAPFDARAKSQEAENATFKK
jgi:tetratricopeptide (TPR) repeat protein